MTNRENCPLAHELAEKLRAQRETLTERWLERITARVEMDPYRVFPTQDLLDHIPLLLAGLADHIENPADQISADQPVVAKALELGELRHKQGFDAHEILKEYEILGGVLFAFLVDVVDHLEGECTRRELVSCAHQLFQGLSLIQQVTTDHYLRLSSERVRERENRLRGFNRAVSHELKNRIGALQNAGTMLADETLGQDRREKLRGILSQSARDIATLIDRLSELSHIDADVLRNDVPLRQAVAEAVRQLRDLAAEKNVEIRVSDDLPEVRVNAATVELCLSNYLGNAIKFADTNKRERWAEVNAHVGRQEEVQELVVEVRDNGIGVREQSRARLFERFYRAAADEHPKLEGSGLGLSIVRDAVEALGGSAWAEHHADGSTFAFSLPLKKPQTIPQEKPGLPDSEKQDG